MIENGKLSAWLPFVCIRHLEQQFPFFDLFNSALKIELAVSPSSQGGLDAILSGRASRNALYDISDKVETPSDKSVVRMMGLLQNLSLRLDMFDLLALIKELEISRMVRI